MTSDTDQSAKTDSFELYCTDCDFEATVTGTVNDALDVADSHQDDHGTMPGEHFVTFKLSGL